MGFDNHKSYYLLEKLAKVWEVETKVFCTEKTIVLKKCTLFCSLQSFHIDMMPYSL